GGMLRTFFPLSLLLLPAACASSGTAEDALPPSPVILAQEAGVELSIPPFRDVHTQWKERIAQPYVYFEHRGPKEGFGETMRALLEYAGIAHVEPVGPPFGLFEGGVSRACLPVEENPNDKGLPFGLLPGGMVAYAVVSGPYPDASQALP